MKTRYGLNLNEVFLLEQGKDMIEICRKIILSSKNYTHNLYSQILVETDKEKEEHNYLKLIGVQQTLSSLYIHETGIVTQ